MSRLLDRGSLLSLLAGAALSGAFALDAVAQGGYQTAVAQGTYAAYSVKRQDNRVFSPVIYFLQTFDADGNVTAFNWVRNEQGGTERVPGVAIRKVTEEALHCEGVYTPSPTGIHQSTCGDDTFDLLLLAVEEIGGVLLATEMRGANRTRGTSTGEIRQFVYSRLPDGWENAIVRGTYATYTNENQTDQAFVLSNWFMTSVDADEKFTAFNRVRNRPGEEPGTRSIQENAEVCDGIFTPNAVFMGISRQTCGRTIYDNLILKAEMIRGVLVVTEMRAVSLTHAGPDSRQFQYRRLDD